MKMTAITSVLGSIALACCGSAAVAATAPFSNAYTGDALPTASTPAWQNFFGGAGTSATASGGNLTVSTTFNEGSPTDLLYRLNSGADWNPTAAGSTLEVRLKVDNVLGTGAGDIGFGTGASTWAFQFRGGSINESLTGGGAVLNTTDTFHTYRFLIPSLTGPVTLYIDGVLQPTAFPGTASAANRIDFGDNAGSSLGQIQWDYIGWTNAGAIAPDVPEPTMLGLAGLGAAGVLARRRRA